MKKLVSFFFFVSLLCPMANARYEVMKQDYYAEKASGALDSGDLNKGLKDASNVGGLGGYGI